MAWKQAEAIEISEKQREILEGYKKGSHAPFHLKMRSEIILKLSDGTSVNKTSKELGIDPTTTRKWRDRLVEASLLLEVVESEEPRKLNQLITTILSDEQRAGTTPKFTDEEKAAIIALSCQNPAELGLPFSHWSNDQLRTEAINRKIVENISTSQVGRFLSQAQLKPHKVQGWLNPNIEDEDAFKEEVSAIFEIYSKVDQLAEEGVLVYSVDEKMGICAREHTQEKQVMKPGVSERIDPEYIRHGTTGIISSLNVATGEIVMPLVQPTRTELDFLTHIESVIRPNDANKHIFIVDRLNIHMSESLVKMVAEFEGIDFYDLGEKGKSGILKSMATRREFLMNESHHIQFAYTPKHTSWLNQIECWFSIITRCLLNKRSSFKSVAMLEKQIHKFINYYNEFLKKPFDWNNSGKFLRFDLYLKSK